MLPIIVGVVVLVSVNFTVPTVRRGCGKAARGCGRAILRYGVRVAYMTHPELLIDREAVRYAAWLADHANPDGGGEDA